METTNFLNAFVAALGWTVLHSIWQITLIYLLYRLVAWFWRQHSQALYLVALIGLAGSAVWAMVSFAGAFEHYAQVREWPTMPAQAMDTSIKMIAKSPVTIVSPPLPWYQQFNQIYESWAAPIGWFWCLGALVLVLRLLGGYWLSQRIRRVGVSAVSEHWAQQCRQWCATLDIRRPVLWLESTQIREPLTLGFWKPLVLFPAGLLLQLHPEQVEALVLHELAHIRRHDYLVNLFQLALEVCFFYHPLFWLLSKEARRQREFCCDQIVLRHKPDPLLYAKTLTELQLSTITLNHFAMYAIGKSAFAQRILRIVNLHPEKAQRSPGLIILFFFLMTGAALSWSAFTSAPQPKSSEVPLVLPKKNLPEAAPTQLVSTPEQLPAAPKPQSHEPEIQAAPDTLSPSVIAVDVNKMNVFYIGVDNPVTVAVPGYDCAKLQVRLSGTGKLIPQGACQFVVQVSQPGDVDVEIFSIENGREKQLGVKTFRVKRIPDPVTSFEGYRSNYIERNEIQIVLKRELQAALENFEFDVKCQVAGFTVAYHTDDNSVFEFPVIGNIIPAERLDAMEKTAKSAIYILDVKAQCPGDSAKRRLNDLVFKIRN